MTLYLWAACSVLVAASYLLFAGRFFKQVALITTTIGLLWSAGGIYRRLRLHTFYLSSGELFGALFVIAAALLIWSYWGKAIVNWFSRKNNSTTNPEP